MEDGECLPNLLELKRFLQRRYVEFQLKLTAKMDFAVTLKHQSHP